MKMVKIVFLMCLMLGLGSCAMHPHQSGKKCCSMKEGKTECKKDCKKEKSHDCKDKKSSECKDKKEKAEQKA